MFLFKIDFGNDFDSVNYGYLNSIMAQIGFESEWKSWVAWCPSSSQALVLVNDSPTKEYPISKGVWQGDPLSPFLFVNSIEGLDIAIQDAREKSLYHDIPILKSDYCLYHLLYANYALFIGD